VWSIVELNSCFVCPADLERRSNANKQIIAPNTPSFYLGVLNSLRTPQPTESDASSYSRDGRGSRSSSTSNSLASSHRITTYPESGKDSQTYDQEPPTCAQAPALLPCSAREPVLPPATPQGFWQNSKHSYALGLTCGPLAQGGTSDTHCQSLGFTLSGAFSQPQSPQAPPFTSEPATTNESDSTVPKRVADGLESASTYLAAFQCQALEPPTPPVDHFHYGAATPLLLSKPRSVQPCSSDNSPGLPFERSASWQPSVHPHREQRESSRKRKAPMQLQCDYCSKVLSRPCEYR
jgi:hypothetical protein